MGAAGLEVVATLALGIYTLRAAAGFRRVAAIPSAAVAAEAVTRLRRLYTTQVGLLALIVAVYLAGGIVGRF
jgi:hypothetical protein